MQTSFLKKEILLNDKSGILTYFPNFFSCSYLEDLKNSIPWEEKLITLFGKTHLQPRLIYFMGDPDISYSYSRDTYLASSWNKYVLEIKDIIQEFLNFSFNSCLCNYYRNGQDSMGWHADNEKELGSNPTIASISFGAKRTFSYKNNLERFSFDLEDSSLLIMSGAFQHNYKHSLPKRKHAEARINLTFRNIKALN